MVLSTSHQIFVFGLCILSGLMCGVFFDVQRFLRRICRAGNVRTTLEDIAFAVVCTVVVLWFGFHFNNGQIRYYQFLGTLSGVLFYAAFISRYIMKLFELFYKAFKSIIIKPVFKICIILFKPIKKVFMYLTRHLRKLKAVLAKVKKSFILRKKHLKKRIKML